MTAVRAAFTLVEVIAVVVVVGIITGIGVVGLDTVLKGLHMGRQTLDLTQKAHVAMQRMILELRFVQPETGSTTPDVTIQSGGAAIVYKSKRDGQYHTIEHGGDAVTYDGYILTDQVQSFLAEQVDDDALRITLTMERIGTFSVEVFP